MIVVVGGGLTGLALGMELRRRGREFLVLEASEQPGGVIRSLEVDGRVLDRGPQRTRRTAAVDALVHELDLEDQVVTAPEGLGLRVWRDGRLWDVPFSLPEVLRSRAIRPLQKLALLLEPLKPGPRADERVDAFLTRKLGADLYDTFLAPLYGGLYASDPADMEVATSLAGTLRAAGVGRSLLLPLLRRGGGFDPPPAISFRDGMATLPRAMATALGNAFVAGSPVRAVEPGSGGWRVVCDHHTLDASAVVLTAPAAATADLVADVAPDAAAALGSLRYNPLAVVHLEAETGLEGLGFQVALDEPLALRGVTFNDNLFGRPDLYTAYLGGSGDPRLPDREDAALARLAEGEFELVTDCPARTLAVGRARVPAWDDTWRALADVTLPPGLHGAGAWASRPGIPGRLAEGARLAEAL